jgi:hypothetical protein
MNIVNVYFYQRKMVWRIYLFIYFLEINFSYVAYNDVELGRGEKLVITNIFWYFVHVFEHLDFVVKKKS